MCYSRKSSHWRFDPFMDISEHCICTQWLASTLHTLSLPRCTLFLINTHIDTCESNRYSVVAESTDPGARQPRFTTYLCHLLALWSWASHLTSLCFSFLIHKIKIIRVSPSKCYFEIIYAKYLEHCLVLLSSEWVTPASMGRHITPQQTLNHLSIPFDSEVFKELRRRCGH